MGEDQQKINKFARHNQRLEDLKEELASSENEIKTLNDASQDVEEASLMMEDGEKIPYMVGEVFIMEDADTVQALLDEKKEEVKEQMKQLESKANGIKEIMSDLKTQLYAKFGDAINLESE